MKAKIKKGAIFLAISFLIIGISRNMWMINRRTPSDDASISVTTSMLPSMSVEDLFRESSLVALGTYTGESDTFHIRAAGGGERIYTDYTFRLDTAVFGENENPTITVRLRGGTIGDETEIYEQNPVFESAQEYLLFLYQPGRGGSYNTEGDYYYVVTMCQGAFEKQEDGSFVSGMGAVLREYELTAPMGLEPSDPISARETYLENLKGTYESGVITKEAYERKTAEINEYATIVEGE